MKKYLSVCISQRGIIGVCFWDRETKKVKVTSCGGFRFSSFVEKISRKWQPDKIIVNKEGKKYNGEFTDFISLNEIQELKIKIIGLEKKSGRYFYYGIKLGNVEQRYSIIMLSHYLKEVENLNLEVNEAAKGLKETKKTLITSMSLEFEITGDWNIQGSSQKDFYISFVARIDDWKRNIIFYREEIGDKAFNFLLNQVLEKRIEKGWKFSVITRGKFMNSAFVSQVLWIENEWGSKIFEENSEY